MTINILNLDPGLRRFGACVVQTDGRRHVATRVGTFASEALASDFSLRACDDRLRRARELDVWLHEFVRGVDVQAVAAESMSFPRGVDPIVAIALAWGVIASFLSSRRLRCVSFTPSYWRTRLIGEAPTHGGTERERKTRTDERERKAHAEVVAAMPSIVRLLRTLPSEHQLHGLDAGGVGLCAIRHDPWVRSLLC